MKIKMVLLLVLLSLSGVSQAALHDRGDGMIYDDRLDITWLQNASASGPLNWFDSVAWADSLSLRSFTYGRFDDWRLASMDVNGDNTLVDCSTASEFACRDNELEYMFYQNLMGSAGGDLRGNQGLFTNIPSRLWSGTESSTSSAYYFRFSAGARFPGSKGSTLTDGRAWAVRDGDVVVTPRHYDIRIQAPDSGNGIVDLQARLVFTEGFRGPFSFNGVTQLNTLIESFVLTGGSAFGVGYTSLGDFYSIGGGNFTGDVNMFSYALTLVAPTNFVFQTSTFDSTINVNLTDVFLNQSSGPCSGGCSSTPTTITTERAPGPYYFDIQGPDNGNGVVDLQARLILTELISGSRRFEIQYNTLIESFELIGGSAFGVNYTSLGDLSTAAGFFDGTVDSTTRNLTFGGDTNFIFRNSAFDSEILIATDGVVFSQNAGPCDFFNGPCVSNGSTITSGRAEPPPPTRGDLDGDGKADILWRNNVNGSGILYLMNGATILSAGDVFAVPNLNWKIVGNGDTNRDGNADILWRNTATGEVYLYQMNGYTIQDRGWVNLVSDLNWQIVANGDMDGDGKADILWRNMATGWNYLHMMNGDTIRDRASINTVSDMNWEIVGNGDMNGDRRADILWRNRVTGENYVYLMNGATIQSGAGINTVADMNWEIVGNNDMNGDGKADILWRNMATGDNYVYLMNGATIESGAGINVVADMNWEIVGNNDLNGDGRSDILWRNKVTGENFLYLMNGGTIQSSALINVITELTWEVSNTR